MKGPSMLKFVLGLSLTVAVCVVAYYYLSVVPRQHEVKPAVVEEVKPAPVKRTGPPPNVFMEDGTIPE